MNAIILSREDADAAIEHGHFDDDFECFMCKKALERGTPGYSWLSVVPDEVLHVIQGGDCSDDMFQRVSKEIYRRENLKPPRIDTH